MSIYTDALSAELIRSLGAELSRSEVAEPVVRFDRDGFERIALERLDELEMMARVDWIAQALQQTLPSDLESSAQLIRNALENDGLHGWASMPVNAYVAGAMIDRPDIGLPLLARLTSRYTAEFAIRPFIESQYEATMAQFERWVSHPDEHVRRLVSEGSRPRLPWGARLARFIEDPRPALELLESLVNDESLYVRRSVANHLNDIAKDHPSLAIETARRWAANSVHGEYVVRHGLRTLVKRGEPAALEILGFDPSASIELRRLSVTPSSIAIGEEVTLTAEILAHAETRAAIDYVAHYQGSRGVKGGKVFKLAVRDLEAGVPTTVTKRHRFAHASIRTIFPGLHRIELQVNGRALGGVEVRISAED